MHLEPADLAEVQRILAFWAPGVPVYVFGSRAHGHGLRPRSDLDLCARAGAPLPAKLLRQVRNAFDVSDLPMRVDLVDWFDLDPGFAAKIEPDFVLVSAPAHSMAT